MTAAVPGAPLKVAIIGTGFGGLGMAYYLKQAGIESFTIFEKSAAVGGVWRDNTYPGAACDLPSHLYSFSFARRHPWSQQFAKQGEILQYLQHCVKKFGLAPHLRYCHEVIAADYDEARGVWQLYFANGGIKEAQIVISAVGQLHQPAYPAIPGRETFAGTSFHSARWDHGYDLTDKTVAVIGTGASAAQFVPEVAKQVKRLYLFQRTPGWFVPKLDWKFAAWERRLLKAVPLLADLNRLRVFLLTEFLGYCYRGHKLAEQLPTLLAKTLLRLQVKDPVLRQKLTPDYSVGCKRLLLSSDLLPTLQRPNVELVTAAAHAITADGVRTADGVMRPVDAIIYGTGFAATRFLAPMQVHGRQGRSLNDQWLQGAEAYLGLAVSGFPNFFMLYGPNTNLGAGSIIYMLERQQRYLVKLLQTLITRGLATAEVRAEVQRDYNRELTARSENSTYAGPCQSWYKTAEGKNTNNWVGSMWEYRRRTQTPQLEHYHLTATGAQSY